MTRVSTKISDDSDDETAFEAIVRACPPSVVADLVRFYGGSQVWLPCSNDLETARYHQVVERLGMEAVKSIAVEVLPTDISLRVYVPLAQKS